MKQRRWLWLVLLLGLFGAACGRSDDAPHASAPTTASDDAGRAGCDAEAPKATEIGVTADAITIEVSADVGSPLAPGLFQGNHDALEAFADYVNDNGGIACRKLVVKLWDSKLSADEAKNGQIDACGSAFAMVGGNSLFASDVTTLVNCKDKAGAETGIPDLPALSAAIEQCNSTTFSIQAVTEQCPVKQGQVRPIKQIVGPTRWYQKEFGDDLHGVFLVPGDLPTTVQGAMPNIAAQEQAGVTFDAVLKVSGRDEQVAYTPRIQAIKANDANYVYDGSNDRVMINLRKEAKAQGVNGVKLWACSLACYTRSMLSAGGADVEDTYLWLQFLPFEEADTNAALKAYVDGVGAAKADSFGAQAWQAAMLFKDAVDDLVDRAGVNGITRKSLLDVLAAKDDFDADGWIGTPKDLRGVSPCIVIMKVEDGKFVRVHPTKKGTLDCDEKNLVTVDLDPAAEAAKVK